MNSLEDLLGCTPEQLKERFGKEAIPSCYRNGSLTYRSKDDSKDNSFYCCLSFDKCAYYVPKGSKEYCHARFLK